MPKTFLYETAALGSWTEANPRQALLKLLQTMVITLQSMEADGSLKSMLCEVPFPDSDPSWVENAAQCAAPAFREYGLEKANEILDRLQTKSAKSKFWRKVARLGPVRGDVALAYERHLWVTLINYSFGRTPDVYRLGHKPKLFIKCVACLLAGYVHGERDLQGCPHCNLVVDRFDELFSSSNQTWH